MKGGKVNDEKNFYDDFGSYGVHDVWEGGLSGKTGTFFIFYAVV